METNDQLWLLRRTSMNRHVSDPNTSSETPAGTSHTLVSLVSMPFKDLRYPPIQLGILERCITRLGIAARSHSFELAFMEHLHSRTAEPDEAPRHSGA